MKYSNEKNGKCIVCGKELVSDGILFDNMPIGAQYILSKDNLINDKGINLKLVTCDNCGLTQFDNSPVDYYKKAIRVVGLSNFMKDLRCKDYELLDKEYNLKNKKIVEVGCGNGDFLLELEKYSLDNEIYGTCEDDDNIKKARAKLKKSNIIKFFPENRTDIIPGAPFDFFLSFNFLEHQPFPVTMLKVIYNSLTDDGIGIITVPSFEYILKKAVYYELIRDHIAYYDINSLRYLCNISGFEVIREDYISIGDTIRFIVRKRKSASGTIVLNNKCFIDLSQIGDSYKVIKQKIDNIVEDHKKNNKTIALWGAGHQGFTIAATTSLKDYVKYIIDSSNEKEGNYSPVSHIVIVKPEYYFKDKVDTIFIVAPAYINEIRKTISQIYGPQVNVIDILNI